MKDLHENDSNYYVGQIVEVFDYLLWRNNGGDSKRDPFIRRGKILKIYREKRSKYSPKKLRMMCDIEFEHDKRVSHGHFLYGIHSVYVKP